MDGKEINRGLSPIICEIGSDGKVQYIGCFVAGTLVHTDKGLLPIEKIRVGMRVLSQPEDGGERDYRPVINTVAHLDQQVYAVQVKVEGATALNTIIATGNHPFWVEAPLVDEKHWMAAECLQPGFVLQLADGKKAVVHAAGLVRRTQHETIGFAADDKAGIGIVLDLSEGRIRLAGDVKIQTLGKLELGAPYLTPVYNFEVDKFHTYYVGEAAVWVHNADCAAKEAIDLVFRKTERSQPYTCFPGDTYVIGRDHQWLKIEFIEVGSWVLSRNEKTGEQAYRRVAKKFEHAVNPQEPGFPIYAVDYFTETSVCVDKTSRLYVTPEHPFWVNDVGWVPACELKSGQKLEICDPNGDSDAYRPEGLQCADVVMSGGRWQATVVSAERWRYDAGVVFNIEVEEFHTYFAGYHGVWVHNKNMNQPAFIQELKLTDPNKLANGEPHRKPSKNEKDPANLKAIEGENKSGDILAQHEMEVVRLRGKGAQPSLAKDGTSKVDYLVEGRLADAYSPNSYNMNTIFQTIRKKTETQSSDVILNLENAKTPTGTTIMG
jgi:hypothetical protein